MVRHILQFLNTHRKTLLQKAVVFVFIAILVFINVHPVAQALTPQQRRDYAQRQIFFIDDPCPSIQTVANTDPNKAFQDTNARIIIGVAKTYNLGKPGALIGLMTGLTETNLRNLANGGKWRGGEYLNTQLGPISLALPHDGEGNDHDSVGLIQQRPTTGWSTFGNGLTKEIIGQLMTPAYAAQAFFGTPPGAKLPEGLAQPGALKKGLQNLPGGWETKDPGQAAQAVQGSAFPDRYNEHKEEAQSFLDRLWESSPAVPLPISITGGAAPVISDVSCGTGTLNSLKDAIIAYAWPFYINPRCGMTCAINATTKKKAYRIAIEAAKEAGHYVGYDGIDCGGFVTTAMIDSGSDPDYNPKKGNTEGQQAYLRSEAAKSNGKFIKVTKGKGTDGLQFGDIAVNAGTRNGSHFGHTFIFTGHFDYIDPETNKPAVWPENAASASGSGKPLSGSDRAPMAGKDAGDADDYEWYRLRNAPPERVQI